MPPPRIHCLLPPKEKFGASGAGAQALKIIQSSRRSRYRDAITVFGSPVAEPYGEVAFQPLKSFWPRLFGNNMGLARAYARAVAADPPDLVECFNRPAVAMWLAKRFPKTPVTVYFGNDPQTMLGSRSVRERRALLDRLAGVTFISQYLHDRFVDGLGGDTKGAKVVRTGMDRVLTEPPVKEPVIVFVGRVVPEKGVLELTQALARVLPRHPQWQAYLIGARWFGAGEAPSLFEAEVGRAAAACDRIHQLGFLPNDEVVKYLRRAAIAAVPSNWDEPFGRTALEALAEGCALICSRRGGLAEVGHRARFLKEVTAAEIGAALEELISDDARRAELQRIAWDDFPFTLSGFAAEWDDFRATLIEPSAGNAIRVVARSAGGA